jgi:hypothetical protein
MLTPTLSRVSLLACAVAAFGGCGGPDTAAVDHFVTALAAAQCQWEFRCCTDAEIMQQEMNKFKDEATCEEFHQLALENTLYSDRLAVRQGRVTVDSKQAQACLDQQNAKMCNPAPGSPPPTPTAPGTVDPCTQVFSGATSVGDECQFANECKKGAHCVPTGASGGQGVCVPFQQEKEICNTSADCDPSVANLYCARQDFTCHLRSPVGGPCAYTIDPVSGMPATPLLLECDNSTNQVFCEPTSMTCKSLPAAGEACLTAPLPPGVNSVCAPGLVCDMPGGTGGTCRGPGAVGDDCTRIACGTSLYCDRTMVPNTCKALPTLGEQCQAAGFQCAKPYYCNTTTPPYVCAAPAQLDQPCPGVTQCDATLYCDTTTTPAMPTCKSRLPDGTVCTQSKQCLSSFCNFTGVSGTCAASGVAVQCIGRM